jgi:hypothetical protein
MSFPTFVDDSLKKTVQSFLQTKSKVMTDFWEHLKMWAFFAEKNKNKNLSHFLAI